MVECVIGDELQFFAHDLVETDLGVMKPEQIEDLPRDRVTPVHDEEGFLVVLRETTIEAIVLRRKVRVGDFAGRQGRVGSKERR